MAAPSRTGSAPRMVSSPSVGGETQPIIRIVEDFPAPFGPRNPKASPWYKSKPTSSTAVKLPNRFVRPRARTSTSGTRWRIPGVVTDSERFSASTAGQLNREGKVFSGAGTATGAGRDGEHARGLSQLSLIRDTYIRFQLLVHEIAKFGVVGAVGFVVQLGVQNLMHSGFGVGPL